MRYEDGDLISVWDADDLVVCDLVEVATGKVPSPARTVRSPVAPQSRFDLISQPQVTRARQIGLTLQRAPDDERFCMAVARADAARDSGDWAVAAGEYRQALALFPLHWGYCIQYAHTVKEQGLFEQAEAWYRSAVALGAPAAMVDQHLAYVARINGVVFARRFTPELDVVPLRAPPTLHDIRLLGELMRVTGLSGDRPMLDLLRQMPDNRAVLLHMLGMPGFARNNRDCLAILRGAHA